MVKDSVYLVSTCQKSVKYFIFYGFFFIVLFCLFPFIGVGWKEEYGFVEMLQSTKTSTICSKVLVQKALLHYH